MSAWTLTTSSLNQSANIEAAAVVDGVLFSNASITTFSMCQDGILGVDESGNYDGTVVDTTNIVVTFTINKDACKNLGYLNENNSLKIKASLSSEPYSSTNSFMDYVAAPIVTLATSGESITPEATASDESNAEVYTADIPLADTSAITLSYPVDISDDGGTSSASNAPYFGTNLKFVFSAEAVKPEANS